MKIPANRNALSIVIPLVSAVVGLFNFSPASAQFAFIDVEVGGGGVICAIRDDKSNTIGWAE